MARARKRSRLILTAIAALILGAALVAAFWPQPILVDFGEVTRGPMRVTIDEEGRTQVEDIYVVSTPVSGFLERVAVEAGEPVIARETVVANMRPSNPAALDVRTREQARTAVDAAQAALRLAQADKASAEAANELAIIDLDRVRQLASTGTASQAALDRAQTNARASAAALQTAEAAIAIREAELANARAQLIGFDDLALAQAINEGFGDETPLHAPVNGRILRILQESEGVLPAGTPILEIGDIETGLRVVVDLISSDAVRVEVGDPVEIVDWGGDLTLLGTVDRIAPFGTTKVSALGVEEQRVGVTIRFESPVEDRPSLGHGYRVEARIIVWSEDDVLRAPSAALFRDGDGWAVFRVDEAGTARMTPVTIGRNNGIHVEITEGLDGGEVLVLYPPAGLAEGELVASRALGDG
ncbi:HlyD family efflux transporter periplasmic adaptor subunit [Ponticoccus sp. SC2-23]|uniref:efflux RND transporter periplasmic adaptor subunit n=1 Tax=Alexandriicola marinus TaxID=2081710 RepID=UPI000FDBB06A|nr:HlyD family efflux transporter periplasmic adaptor subunit [Alexandriicola marinus]MBM1219915.1 HlyD family efflux transporter periplasmic adaptor subunit [Ponticoccus sp. SC6-9]MBM1224601.1 HlyD family efflux transporter periplasmic adaptor subunit [Ponticoccus sp. SC6-15]MBM1228114.1 HlyD family efflux transporter periplasmic adaptor subunit [Ponticoccus sp. SC6-38]MBM1234248.1 HlyD family efflux transporter periplasmic adaptor subunit [Ponticoccus sp. SC6-45]MBM1238616.1 HlyD family effl